MKKEAKSNRRRVALAIGAAAGGLLAAAILPVAVAVADDDFDFAPTTTSFDPTQVEGYPPLVNVVTGTEYWSVFDMTDNSEPFGSEDLYGTDTVTTFGSFTNDDFLYNPAIPGLTILGPGTTEFFIPSGTQIDLADFGGGFENEWIDMPANGTGPGVSDLLITPFGDFPLLGSAFTDLATLISSI